MPRMVIQSDSEGSEDEEQKPKREEDEMEVDETGSGPQEDEELASSPKRRRTKGPAPTLDDVDEVVKLHDLPAPPPRRQIQRDTDGFVTGSIVRIAMENFLTYDFVEFNVGPRLNMIVGPNGSGKSSIVACIAVGLGFNLKLIGRATDQNEYIKRYKDSGWVEIELKGKPGGKNVVVRRYLSKKPSERKYTLNGKAATDKEVKAKVADLKIELGNVCCFLPQERVPEFTQLNAKDLLLRTQEAAGAVYLSDWHRRLIDSRNKLKEESGKLASLEKELAIKSQTVKDLEKDVQRHAERQKAENNVKALTVAIPFARYETVKMAHAELKKARDALDAEVAELERKRKPYVDTKQALDKRVEKSQKMDKQLAFDYSKKRGEVLSKVKDMEKLKEEADEIKAKMEGLHEDEARRKRNIQQRKVRITKLEGETSGPAPTAGDTGAIQTQLNDLNTQLRAIHSAVAAHQDDIRRLQRDIGFRDTNINRANDRIKDLKDATIARWRNFGRHEPNHVKAWEWIHKNPDKVGAGAYPPVAMSVTIKDWRFARAIETLLPNETLKTILMKRRKDYDPVARELNGSAGTGQNLRVNIAEIEGKPLLNSYKPPWTREELRQEGFECWALDVVEGPDEVLAYLCETSNLHRIPMTSKQNVINGQRYEEQEMGIRRYIEGDTQTTISASRYGNREAFTVTRFLQLTKYFSKGVDAAQVARHEDEIRDYQKQKDDLEAEMKAIRDSMAEERGKEELLKDQMQTLSNEKKAIQAKLKAYTKKVNDLQAERIALQRDLDKPSLEEQIDRANDELREKARRQMGAADVVKVLVFKLTDILEKQTINAFEECQAQSDVEALTQGADERDRVLQDKKKDLAEAKEETAVARAKALDILKGAKELFAASDDEVKKLYHDKCEEWTAMYEEDVDRWNGAKLPPHHDLEQEKRNSEEELGMTAQVAGAVVARYEERKREVETLRAKRDSEVERQEGLTRAVEELKSKWVPALRGLVAAISEKFAKSFAEMNIQGEVKIRDDSEEDYAKWGIDIMVSFRDKDPMTPLDGGKNSGGERSLSTMCYLMALTELNNAPFTVVDEINQGMDPRAERAMHNQLVVRTCVDTANQYFLLTPKLLNNLNYDPQMKILCVLSGEYAPDSLNLTNEFAAIRERRAAKK